MSDTPSFVNVPQAYIDTYHMNLIHALQQEQSKLSPFVTVGNMTGKKKAFTYIGKADMTERVDKNGNTHWDTQEFARRWASRRIFDRGVIIDKYDDVESALTDPTGDCIKSAVMAANRRKDRVILDGLIGPAWTGAQADVKVDFPAGNVIDIKTGSSASADEPLNIAKLKEIAARMDDAEVPENDRVIIVSRRQVNALLDDDRVTSADYNNVRALVSGQLDTFFGFKFVISNLLAKEAGVRGCFAFQKDCVQLAISTDLEIKGPVPIPEKHFNLGLEVTMALDAFRLFDEGVYSVPCKE